MTFRLVFIFLALSQVCPAQADNKSSGGFHFEFGEEYSEYNRTTPSSPPTPSRKSTGKKSSFWRGALLYLPNRVLDLIDVFKIDIGAGVGYGGVIRPTKYLQAGYRDFEPGMLRVGLMGRRWPVMIEDRRIEGFGRDYGKSSRRKVSPGEFGLGLDAGLVGAYGGVSFDSAADFVLGIVGIDFEDDDLQ